MNATLWILIRIVVAAGVMVGVACLQVNSFSETEQHLVLTTVAALAGADILQQIAKGKTCEEH